MASRFACFSAKRLLLVLAMMYSACGLPIVAGQVCPQSGCTVACVDGLGESIRNSLCRCDPKCALYDDCCNNYWTNCVNASSSESHTRPTLHSEYSEYLGCVSPIDIDSFYNHFVVVDRCPLHWPQDATKGRCENTTLSRQNKLLTLFVNGPDDLVFKNVYCSFCHGIQERQIRPWSAEIWSCNPAEGETRPVPLGGNPDYTTCSEFRMQPPPSMTYDPHRCYPTFIDRCPINSTADDDEIQLCQNHTSLLFHKHERVVYKNVHCWNCSSSGSSDFHDLACKSPINLNARFDPLRSFTLLFDFTSRMVHSVTNEGIVTRTHSAPELLKTCNQWQIYDPFQDICVDLTCPYGDPLESSSGECLDEQSRIVFGSVQPKPSDECLENLIVMNSSEVFTHSTDFWTSADIADGLDNQHYILNIFTSFHSAGRTQNSLDLILSSVTDASSCASLFCNASSVILVASNQSETPKNGMCEGYNFGNINFTDLLVLDGVFSVNISGFVYDQHEFMHKTEYSFDTNEASVIKHQSVTLCNPFVGSRSCSVLTLYPDEYSLSTDGSVLVDAGSGVPFSVGEYWLLPDGTMRVCQTMWYHVLAYVSYAGSCCSVLGLILGLVTYGVFPSLRNTPGKIVMNLMGALLMAQLFLMFTSPQSWFCVLRAVMLHFSWLSVFFWMSVLSCDLAYHLKSNVRPQCPARRGGSDRWKILKLSAIAWGVPAVIVVSCFLASQFGHNRLGWFQYGGSSCWIVVPFHSVIVFGSPIVLCIAVNVAMFVFMTSTVIANYRRLVAARMAQHTKTTILMCFKIATVTGLTWTLFILANVVREPAVWFSSVLSNSLQGALIAAIFLLNASVRELWRERLARVRACAHACRRSCCSCCCRRGLGAQKRDSGMCLSPFPSSLEKGGV